MAKQSKRLIILLLILVPIGISMKSYSGPGADWVSVYLIKVVFIVFWCLALRLILDKPGHEPIATAVFLGACALEFLQLWDPPFLQMIRSTLPGQVLLEEQFTWNDFPYYFVGAMLAYQIMSTACGRPS